MSTLNNTLLNRAFSGISFEPERRAASTRADFNNDILEYASIVKGLPEADNLIAAYTAGLAARYNKWLASSGRCVSWWVAGPAKYPARKQQKMMDIEHRRMTDLLEWQEHQLKKARALVKKADGRGPILSSDKDAPDQLRKKIEHLEAVHSLVVEVNKKIRKSPENAKIWITEQREKTPAKVYSAFLLVVKKYAFSACNGGIYGDTVAPFWLSLDNKNIKRLKSRLAEIEKKREIFNGENDYRATDGTKVEFNGEENRIRLFFEAKPEREMREKLKKAGFRWSPKAEAWQSFLNAGSRIFVEKEFPRNAIPADALTYSIQFRAASQSWLFSVMPKELPEDEEEKRQYRHFLASGYYADVLAALITCAEKNEYPKTKFTIVDGSGKFSREKFITEWMNFSSQDFIFNSGEALPEDAPKVIREAWKIAHPEKNLPMATLPTLPPLAMQPSPSIMRGAAKPCCLACAIKVHKMMDFKYPCRQTGLMKRLNLRGVEACTSWHALHDENGILKYSTEKGSDGKTHRVYKFRHIAEAFLRFAATLPISQQWKSCNGGNIAGFNGKNPERICSMAALWGMVDISGQLFRTPADWKKAGYELKETARPFFVVTPKFTEKMEKVQDAETGEEIDQITITGSSGQYNIFPVYCSEDVSLVRTVKRRAPREKKADTELEAMTAAYTAAAEKSPAVHPADRENMRQMALAL